MEPLTNRQAETLEFITTYYRKHGVGPTYREIGKGIGVTSPNGVLDLVNRLRRKGAITPADGSHRTRQIVPAREPGICPCCGQKVKAGNGKG